MKERIASFLGHHSELAFVGTFHSYCVQLLKKIPRISLNPFFSILDSDDQTKMIQGILQRNGLQKQFTAKNIPYDFSNEKSYDANHNQQQNIFLIPC